MTICVSWTCTGAAMAEEDEYVAGTIATIGSLITKPKMTEKYLKKPPFRLGRTFWALGESNDCKSCSVCKG